MDQQKTKHNTLILLNIAMILALALTLSLTAPASQFPLALSAVCSFAGFVVGLVAAFQRENVFQSSLCNWDAAAFFYALSLIANGFVQAGPPETIASAAVKLTSG